MHAQPHDTQDEIAHVVGQLHVQHDELDGLGLVEDAHVAHDGHQVNALEQHLSEARTQLRY